MPGLGGSGPDCEWRLVMGESSSRPSCAQKLVVSKQDRSKKERIERERERGDGS